MVVCFHSITRISGGAGALVVLWSGEFVSFHTGIQPAWLGVSEGPRCAKGQNLGTECALSAFAVPATRVAGFVGR